MQDTRRFNNPNAIGSDILASRIWRRDANTTQNPDFSEDRMTSPEMVQFALHGRSVLGDPMFNPVTGKQTNFAFTGDPVTGTGWLEERHDGRSMISLQPITLSPGERASFTVVYFWLRESQKQSRDWDIYFDSRSTGTIRRKNFRVQNSWRIYLFALRAH